MLTPSPPVLGQKYRLIRQLEVGGMGSVWLAEHVQLSSLVAVKLMGKEVAATPAGTQRFLREARTAASLRSPHVVQILDYGVHDGTPFIVMELLEGESLAARLEREGRFQSWERAELVLRHVARAVARAHAAGIIHRDLKPANIFLVRDEEEEVVKLLDFGIAKPMAAPLSASPGTDTRTGEFLGSPAYASPEQLQVSKTLDHRADIWSLGVIAYECLIGRPPFAADTLVGVVLEICSHPLPIPSERGSVPVGFDAWFARACARNVEQRFQSVREASAELRRLVAAACGAPSPPSERESGSLPPPARVPPSAPESLPAVQTPPSAPEFATVRQPRFSRRGPARVGTLLTRPSEPPRAGIGVLGVQRGRRPRLAPLLAALTVLAAVPLLLFALRALAARAGLDRSVLGLGPAPAGEPAPADLAARGETAGGETARGETVHGETARGETAARGDEPAPADLAVSSDPPARGDAPPSPIPNSTERPQEPQRAASPPPPAPPKKPKAPPARAAAPRPSRSWLTITASAPSNVLLDGIPLGATPLADVAIESGVHEVTFLHGRERSAQTVEIRAGERKRVAARIEPARGDGLDEVAVQRTLRDYGPSVRDICWQRALSSRAPGDPTSVRVSATITVEPSGRVHSVVTSDAPAAYPDLCRCIEEKVRVWRFPSALGQTVVNVPFVFVTE